MIEGKERNDFRRAQRVARVIRLNGIGLRYTRGSEVLHDVTFHLRPGSFHFLTGPSGSGKTSLLRLLFMSIQPTRGAIHVLGQDIARVTPAKRAQLRRRIGIVFQDFRLLEHMTTWENIAMPLRVSGKRVSDYKEDVTDLLQWVGLGDRMHSYPSVLSPPRPPATAGKLRTRRKNWARNGDGGAETGNGGASMSGVGPEHFGLPVAAVYPPVLVAGWVMGRGGEVHGARPSPRAAPLDNVLVNGRKA